MNNKIKIVYLSFDSWFSYLTNDRQVRCVNLPRDAKVERACPCETRMGYDVVVWLSSLDFDEVPEGAVIPEYRLLFEEVRPEMAVAS